MGVCGGRWVGGVEGGRICLQNDQIHDFDQHYKVLLVIQSHTIKNKHNLFFLKIKINKMVFV